MARVDIDDVDDEKVGAAFAEDAGDEEPRQSRAGAGRKRRPAGGQETVEVEIEREITKRQIIQSVSSILVVILYMLFTLLRDRDAGVVVVEDEGPEDDWAE